MPVLRMPNVTTSNQMVFQPNSAKLKPHKTHAYRSFYECSKVLQIRRTIMYRIKHVYNLRLSQTQKET
jgi:hypothetical protein